MTRSLKEIAVVSLGLLCVAGTTLAQTPQRQPPGRNTFGQTAPRPAVSPYLQLLRPEALEVPNYQTLVRPQIEMREAEARNQMAIQQLQQEVATSFPSMRTGGSMMVRPTGHTSQFLNYLHFYPQTSR